MSDEKSGFHTASNPPYAGSAMQQEPPPPYSSYPTGPTELDASKPYAPVPTGPTGPIGFQPQQQQQQQQPPPSPMPIIHAQGQPMLQNPGQMTTVITTAPVVHQVITSQIPLGPDSVRMVCPFCQADMNTTTIKNPSVAAWITAAVCFLVGCVWGCCLIPLCVDSCKKVEHQCANCNRLLGRYSQY